MKMGRVLLGKVQDDIQRALQEDCPTGDITSESCLDAKSCSTGYVVAKQSLTLAGLEVFKEVMKLVDRSVKVKLLAEDGTQVKKGSHVLSFSGSSISILKGERVALNYMQRMCGTATLTAAFVNKVKGSKAKILDTRKTDPNMRLLQKYAVLCGGGVNHRMGLSDAPLIKENHIRAAGSIAEAVARLKKKRKRPIILEVENKEEVLQGVAAGVDILLLDNMTPAKARSMIKLVAGRAECEVSGNVNLRNVAAYGKAGADRISIGALTHSAGVADLSLLLHVR